MPHSTRSASMAQSGSVATAGLSQPPPQPTTMTTALIDLTSSSPPPGNRRLALPRASSTNANAQAGPSNASARARSSRATTSTAATDEAIVLSSDSEGDADADILVFEPTSNAGARVPGGPLAGHGPQINLRRSTARRLLAGAAATAPASRAGSPDLDADLRLARELQAEENRNFGIPIGLPYNAPHARAPPPAPAYRGSLFARLGELVRQGFYGNRGIAPAPAGARRHRPAVHDEDDFVGLGQALFAANGIFDNIAGEPNGFWPGAPRQPKVKPVKRYTVKTSHPRKVEPGFARDIVSEEDALEKVESLKGSAGQPIAQAGSTAKKRRRGGATAIKNAQAQAELEPVCASCLDPLYLAQSGDQRIWALKCGHVVCGKCLTFAQSRCRDIRKQERENRWQYDVDGPMAKAKRSIMLDSSDDENDLDFVNSDEEIHKPKKRRRKQDSIEHVEPSGSSSDKGKAKSRSDETGIEEEWTTCPVVSCSGEGTNLLAPPGSNAVPDAALTPDGLQQSRKLHDDTKDSIQQQAQVLLVSPLRRTMQTALIGYSTLRERGVETVLVPELQEVNDLPCDTGSSREQLEMDPTFASLDLSPLDEAPIKHDGASWTSKKGFFAPEKAAERAAWVRRALRDRPEDKIVVVAHGDILRYLVYGKNTHEPWGNTETRLYTFKGDDMDNDAWLIEIEQVAKEGANEPTSSDMKN
ncbi:hypothetical protein OIV83_004646 [Microbotryomycetes sp. JL201]|nr:hypothetical protein OIV83_004646 [Microbotryomycetes sp. JL201]